MSIRQIYEVGLTRGELRAELDARRWIRIGTLTIQVALGDHTSAWWLAIFEVAPTAVLDGITALHAAGLKLISSNVVHVSVPRSTRPRRCSGVHVHETRRLRDEDVNRAGIPRTRPATATVHAALWARSDREAALIFVAAVQQRLVSMPDLTRAVARVEKHSRRRLLQGLLKDVADGVQSLGEGDFAAGCRRRKFPEADRQEAVQLPSGRVYFDITWTSYGLKVEIHGAHHLDVRVASKDMLKANAASLSGARVLQFPNYALRTEMDACLDQVDAGLRAGGWPGAAEPLSRVRGHGA